MPILFYVLHLQQTAFSYPFSCFSSPPCLFGSFSLSVVLLQTPEELDDSDFETEDFDVRSRTSVQTEDDQLIAGQSARVSFPSLLVVFTDIPESPA